MSAASAVMRTLRLARMPPAMRVSLGLCALLMTCLLVLDLIFGIVPDTHSLQQQLRQRTSENVAMQVAGMLESGDTRALAARLNDALARDPALRSVGVRGANGKLLLQVG